MRDGVDVGEHRRGGQTIHLLQDDVQEVDEVVEQLDDVVGRHCHQGHGLLRRHLRSTENDEG